MDEAKVDRKSLVWSAMDRLQNSIMSLEDNVTMMESRLESTLSPPQIQSKDEGEDSPTQSSLTASVENNTNRIRNASSRLNDLLDRTEL